MGNIYIDDDTHMSFISKEEPHKFQKIYHNYLHIQMISCKKPKNPTRHLARHGDPASLGASQ